MFNFLLNFFHGIFGKKDRVGHEDRYVLDNLCLDQLRSGKQILLSLVIDQSPAIYQEGLVETIDRVMKEVKNAVTYYGSQCIQTSTLFFGAPIKSQPFRYGDQIDDLTYPIDEPKTRLFDALLMSGQNMVAHFEKIRPVCKQVKAYMVIFVSNANDNSEKASMTQAAQVVKQLNHHGVEIICLTSAPKNSEMSKSLVDIGLTPYYVKGRPQLVKSFRLIAERAITL